ncbi:MAG TPA: hypothetical protein VFF52_07840, partial [Isosphaeraceae bacterium]|nr:hypothetical protein [Isosphaeraceae bacterium]
MTQPTDPGYPFGTTQLPAGGTATIAKLTDTPKQPYGWNANTEVGTLDLRVDDIFKDYCQPTAHRF